MKKILFILVAALFCIGAAANVQIQFLKSDFFKGWRPDVDGIVYGLDGYSELKNMRPEDGALIGIPGYSKINTTALATYTNIRDMRQLWTEGRTNESYLLAHVAHGTAESSNTSRVYLNKTEPDAQGDFEATLLHTDSGNGLDGRLAAWPDGLAYTNGEESYQYWGEEHNVGGFFTLSDISITEDDFVFNAGASTCVTTDGNFLDNGFSAGHIITVTGGANDGDSLTISTISANGKTLTFSSAPTAETLGTDQTIEVDNRKYYTDAVDYTKAISNSLQTSGNTVDTYGGLDSNTKLLIHANGSPSDTITDSSTTGHTISKTDDADISNDAVKWGTGSAVFDGDGDNIYAADHADWNFGTDEISIDTWVKFDDVDAIHTIFYQEDGVTDYDGAWLVYDGLRDKIYFRVVSSSGTVLIHEEGSWSPTVSTWYHVALVRGWGGGANAWAITVNGTSVATFTASVTMPDLASAFYIGGGADQATLDYSGQDHPVSFTGTAAITSTEKWGTGGLLLDGNSDYVTLPDSADWDIVSSNTGSKTIGLWVKHTDHVGQETYASHYEGAGNYWLLDHTHGTGIRFIVVSGSATIITLTGGEITDTDWHHVAVAIVGDGSTKDIGIYLDGVQVAHTQDNSTDDFTGVLYFGNLGAAYLDGSLDEARVYDGNAFSATPVVGLTDTITVPTAAHTTDASTDLLLHCDVSDLDGYVDEFRVSDTARWTANFAAPDRAYKVSQNRWRVFSSRPLKAIKFYIANANMTASTLSGYVWTGRSFSTLSLTDGTKPASISMAQTGTVDFGDTYDNAEPAHFEGTFLYCYEFELSAGGCEIYQVSADGGFSPINDIWTGEYELPFDVRFYDASAGKTIDYTIQANNTSSDGTPYGLLLDGMTSSDYVLAGFEQRVSALKLDFLTDYVNDETSEVSVAYRSGSGWVDVGSVDDETHAKTALKTAAQSGVISWSPAATSDETLYNPYGTPGYFYKITVSGTLTDTSAGIASGDEDVVVDLLSGIPAQYEIQPTVGSGQFKGRAVRWNFAKGNEPNRLDYSVTHAPNAWNGEESSMGGVQALYIGNSEPITQTGELYNRYGSNIYVTMTVTKRRSTYLIHGDGPEDYKIFPISYNVGCPAPKTFVGTNFDVIQDVRRNVQFWLDYSGPVMFDGETPRHVPGIDNFFDESSSEHIDFDNIDKSSAIFDSEESEYILCFPLSSGSYKCVAYNLESKFWYEVVPEDYPLSMADVVDGNGVRYIYWGMSNGHVMHYGDTPAWDGTAIAHSWATGDFVLTGNDFDITRLEFVHLMMAETDEALSLTLQHYSDTDSSANSTTETMVMESSDTNRIRMITFDTNSWTGRTHRLRYSVSAGAGAGAAVGAIKAYRQSMAYTVDHQELWATVESYHLWEGDGWEGDGWE